MTDAAVHVRRRTVLGTIVGSTLLPLAGCTGSGNPAGEGSNPIRAVSVADLHLVVEVREDASIDELTVVSPNGEAFATRSLSPGVRRETVELGTSYTPGSYEIHASADGETVGESSIDIRPDVQIVDLKLGRNHPDEMYEGATEQAIRSEVIVSLENRGTGPDAVTALRFDGDVPFPTRENFEESGIYDTESDIGGNRERILIGTGTEVTLFSNSQPFSPAGGNISCEDGPVDGQVAVELTTQLSDSGSTADYDVSYRGNDDFDCDITVAQS
ncbi:hypothetical protein [Halorarum salinum]|uniref:Secreted glycoprotein n=1 Tax=Halorarum salinum TaxID=2743089 RepID=A0A7D5L9E2_9EURY|nr:hypothetical protein [Halobaculum salinum]QLG61067.1 hypothetical protein HUG12_04670 [Halobaculum salinum]